MMSSRDKSHYLQCREAAMHVALSHDGIRLTGEGQRPVRPGRCSASGAHPNGSAEITFLHLVVHQVLVASTSQSSFSPICQHTVPINHSHLYRQRTVTGADRLGSSIARRYLPQSAERTLPVFSAFTSGLASRTAMYEPWIGTRRHVVHPTEPIPRLCTRLRSKDDAK
jgi:hypothetical protein